MTSTLILIFLAILILENGLGVAYNLSTRACNEKSARDMVKIQRQTITRLVKESDEWKRNYERLAAAKLSRNAFVLTAGGMSSLPDDWESKLLLRPPESEPGSL